MWHLIRTDTGTGITTETVGWTTTAVIGTMTGAIIATTETGTIGKEGRDTKVAYSLEAKKNGLDIAVQAVFPSSKYWSER